MSSTIRKGPAGELIFTEETHGEQHSVEVGTDARGNQYVKSIKAYTSLETDIPALENKLAELVEAELRVLRSAS